MAQVLSVESRNRFGERDFSALVDLDELPIDEGVDVDQATIRFEQAMDFLQGMNHALMFHSSKRPGEDGDVEDRRFAGSCEFFEGGLVKIDAVAQLVRQIFLRLANAF